MEIWFFAAKANSKVFLIALIPTNYFSVTKEQFYDNNYNPNEAQGLGDMSLVFIPAGKVTNSFLKYIPNHLEKPLKYSNVNKISKQMKKRGWTEKDIREAMKTKGIPTTGKNGPAIPKDWKIYCHR